MLSLYLVCAILGGVLVLFSAIAGLHGHGDVGGHSDLGGHGDLGHHGDPWDHDPGHVGGHAGPHEENPATDSASWLPFTSLRFYVYLLAAFGIVGTVLTLTKMSAEPLTLGLSSGTGVLSGLLATFVVTWLRRADVSSAVRYEDFMGATGIVSVPIRVGSPGKLRSTIRGDVIDVIALPAGDEEILSGEEVVILDMEGHIARVARASDVLQEMRRET